MKTLSVLLKEFDGRGLDMPEVMDERLWPTRIWIFQYQILWK